MRHRKARDGGQGPVANLPRLAPQRGVWARGVKSTAQQAVSCQSDQPIRPINPAQAEPARTPGPEPIVAPQHMAESTTDEGTYRIGTSKEEERKTKQALAWRANLVRLAMKENNEMMAVMDELMDVNRPARTTNG